MVEKGRGIEIAMDWNRRLADRTTREMDGIAYLNLYECHAETQPRLDRTKLSHRGVAVIVPCCVS